MQQLSPLRDSVFLDIEWVGLFIIQDMSYDYKNDKNGQKGKLKFLTKMLSQPIKY